VRTGHILFLLASVVGCRTTSTSQMPGPSAIPITRASPTRAWEMWDAGRYLGAVVRFEEQGNAERAFYSVRNREGQEIGIVDLYGRVWRYRAHESEPEWLGTGTVFEGALKILGGSPAGAPVEVDVRRLQEILGNKG
jgi:hypothetical protein